MSAPRRTLPADFREVAPTLTLNQAKRHWATNITTIKRWHDEAGTTSMGLASRMVDMPADFESIARLSLRKLQAEHGIPRDKAVLWRRNLGIVVKAAPPPVEPGWTRADGTVPGTARPPRPKKPPIRRATDRKHNQALATQRDASMAGIAAEDLRRAGYVPVCRATIRDPKANADEWIVGRRTLTTDDMMRLAAERARPSSFFTTSTGARA